MSSVKGPLPSVAAGPAVHTSIPVNSALSIDPCFIFPEEERSSIPHDRWDADLPTIELGPVLNLLRLQKELGQQEVGSEARRNVENEIKQCEAARERVEKEIREGCEECGFFQIVNHGVPMEVVEKLKHSVKGIFDLPLEEKMKATYLPPTDEKPLKAPGYYPITRVNTYQKVGKNGWSEGFNMDFPEVLYPGRLEDNVSCLWPEEPGRSSKGLQLRSIGREYAKQANSLSLLVLNLIATSLGLPEGTMQEFLGGERQDHLEARFGVVRYPTCPHPELTFGAVNHCDPSLITLLHQDIVGGLQIRFRDGTWHGVRPVPGAFVVNVGNFLQAVTNGRFISAEHRVVANNKVDRFSVVYFVWDNMDSVFSPRPELVDAQHPLLYRPFSRREYLAALREYGQISDKRYIPDRIFA